MSARTIGLLLLVGATLLTVTGCGVKDDKPASRLTQAERDTVLARSALPGASVVQRALDVNGVAAERATGLDSIGR
ncbi:MAG: hypothetical protein ABIU54_02970 [Candidatus Eisenbacteria bacterium]